MRVVVYTRMFVLGRKFVLSLICTWLALIKAIQRCW